MQYKKHNHHGTAEKSHSDFSDVIQKHRDFSQFYTSCFVFFPSKVLSVMYEIYKTMTCKNASFLTRKAKLKKRANKYIINEGSIMAVPITNPINAKYFNTSTISNLHLIFNMYKHVVRKNEIYFTLI